MIYTHTHKRCYIYIYYEVYYMYIVVYLDRVNILKTTEMKTNLNKLNLYLQIQTDIFTKFVSIYTYYILLYHILDIPTIRFYFFIA